MEVIFANKVVVAQLSLTTFAFLGSNPKSHQNISFLILPITLSNVMSKINQHLSDNRS